MKFKIGDRVAYSVQWLKSTCQQAGELGHARGVIVALQPLGERTLAEIDWGNPDVPRRVMTCNLAKVGANTRFCAC